MKKKTIATKRIKIFPNTHKKLKILAAKEEKTMAELIDFKFFPVHF